MSTATEIKARMVQALPIIEASRLRLDALLRDMVIYSAAITIGREICAKRASKLRRRGEYVRYVGRSKTGKSRYRWLSPL
jgi:hypothetical protein